MTPHPIATWHALVASRNAEGLDALLADDVVFHSPVVHAPQHGRAITRMYLSAALHVLGGPRFHYVRELVGDHDAVLEFETLIDGVHVNGVDLVRWNAEGRIVDFKVMLRPLKAVNLIHERMAALLASMKQGGSQGHRVESGQRSPDGS